MSRRFKKNRELKKFKYSRSKIDRPKAESRASDRLTRVQRKKRLRKIYFIATLVVLGGLIYLFFFSPILKIKNIIIDRPNKIEENINDEKIKNKIDLLSYHFKWLFFPQRNILIFSKKEASDEIQNLIAFEKLTISRKIFKKEIKITIQEKQPALTLFCQEKYYLFAADGKLIKEIPAEKLNSNLNLVYYQPPIKEELVPGGENEEGIKNENQPSLASQTGTETGIETENKEVQTADQDQDQIYEYQTINVNDINLNPELIKFINDFKEKFKAKIEKFKIDYFQIDQDNPLALTAKTSEKWDIYLDPKGDIDQQLNNLIIVLDNKIKDDRANLEYVDLKFGNRVYYK